MSSFAALMELSRTHTAQALSDAQTVLEQRRRREALARKRQAEHEEKEKKLQESLRLHHFEKLRKEQERLALLEQQRKEQEAELARREAAQREALRYGPKKHKATLPATSDDLSPSSSSTSSKPSRKRRSADGDDDDDGSAGRPAALALTREEKRRKAEAKLLAMHPTTKREPRQNRTQKEGRRLPGGAIDVTTTSRSPSADPLSGRQSVKARIAAMPMTLTKLNVVKRDTRTIDEILQDRAKLKEAKVLDGEQARGFNDWFGISKKMEAAPRSVSAPGSGTNTPTPQLATKNPSHPSSIKSTVATQPPKRTIAPSTSSDDDRDARHTTLSSRRDSTAKSAPAPLSRSGVTSSSSSLTSKRHPLSPSSSSASIPASPPARTKRRPVHPLEPTAPFKTEIWKLFGKVREDYVGRDVSSDDEDMEADARAVWEEERRSARFAKLEDLKEMEAERRREEEKKRKKREREFAERAPARKV